MKKPVKVKLEILADGVFIANDVRMNKGDIAEDVDPKVAAQIVENGHGKLL